MLVVIGIILSFQGRLWLYRDVSVLLKGLVCLQVKVGFCLFRAGFCLDGSTLFFCRLAVPLWENSACWAEFLPYNPKCKVRQKRRSLPV